MGVYLPTAAIGNGRVLATLGGSGEIMSFFYPRLDFAQNVRECLPALYVGDPGHGVFHWTFSPAFRRSQAYFGQTNLLRTQLDLVTPPLQILMEDFCPPGTTALIRHLGFTNTGDRPFRGTFLHYFDLRLGEVAGKQAVSWHPQAGYMLQYFRDIVIAVGGTRPDLWRCGKSVDSGSPASAKEDMLDGHLNGQPEDIGQVDFALGYRLDLGPGEQQSVDLFLGAEVNPHRTSVQIHDLVERGYPTLRERTRTDDEQWLGRAQPLKINSSLEAAYQRALLSLRLLADINTHAIIAAPEFDPAFEQSGGYGYCWPRDASAAAASLKQAGYPEYLHGLADWYAQHQLPSGLWGQRYWSEGQLAASWALRGDFLQLDQCGAALQTMAQSARAEPDAERRQHLWPAIQRGAQAITATLADGWHHQACDLWETYCGVFLYTNAALATGLVAAAEVAVRESHQELAKQWKGLAAAMRERVLGLYTGEYFPRGLRPDGQLDLSVDSSTLGLIAPLEMINLQDAEQRERAESHLQVVRQRLGQELGGQVGLRRYEGDAYLGGAIGCVNTLWAALVSLKLARAGQSKDEKQAAAYRQQALADIDFCLANSTPTGLLPELIGRQPDTPYWAAPHAWASALFLDCIHELSGLNGGG